MLRPGEAVCFQECFMQQPIRATAIVVLGFAIGCGDNSGPKLAQVSGTIKVDGKPIPGLNVFFVPEAGGAPSVGGTNAAGKYTLLYPSNKSGAIVGKPRVRVEAPEPESDDSGKPTAAPVKLPNKELAAEVKPGNNTINFDLKSE